MRWSESNQYPHHIPTIWQPGEVHTYQWQWHVDPQFAPHTVPGKNGVVISLQTGAMYIPGRIIPAGTLDVVVGIGEIEVSPFASVPCRELQQTHRLAQLPKA